MIRWLRRARRRWLILLGGHWRERYVRCHVCETVDHRRRFGTFGLLAIQHVRARCGHVLIDAYRPRFYRLRPAARGSLPGPPPKATR